MRIFAKNKMAKHNELGKEGENAAAEYLMSKGYSICLLYTSPSPRD